MNQEDKELLFKDLCTRLPYGVKVAYRSRERNGDIELTHGNIGYVTDLGKGWWLECKPYLRPLSSMTEEEAMEYANCGNIIANSPQNNYLIPNPNCVDWLNAHHFDYRGLIEKGLAIEVTEEKSKDYDTGRI